MSSTSKVNSLLSKRLSIKETQQRKKDVSFYKRSLTKVNNIIYECY